MSSYGAKIFSESPVLNKTAILVLTCENCFILYMFYTPIWCLTHFLKSTVRISLWKQSKLYYLCLSFTSLHTDLIFLMKKEHLTRPCTFFLPQECEKRMSRAAQSLLKVLLQRWRRQFSHRNKAEGKKCNPLEFTMLETATISKRLRIKFYLFIFDKELKALKKTVPI